jgi:hypothetical protein
MDEEKLLAKEQREQVATVCEHKAAQSQARETSLGSVRFGFFQGTFSVGGRTIHYLIVPQLEAWNEGEFAVCQGVERL